MAIILFGPERLPEFARKAARVLRYVRTIAGNAQEQLSKELGPGFEDLDLRDLNPKAFVQKHLLDDVEPIVADVKNEISAVGKPLTRTIGDVGASINVGRGDARARSTGATRRLRSDLAAAAAASRRSDARRRPDAAYRPDRRLATLHRVGPGGDRARAGGRPGRGRAWPACRPARRAPAPPAGRAR